MTLTLGTDEILATAHQTVLEAVEKVELALRAVAAAERAHTAAEARRDAAISSYAELSSPGEVADRLGLPLTAVRAAVKSAQEPPSPDPVTIAWG